MRRNFLILAFIICAGVTHAIENPLHRISLDAGWQFTLTERNPMLGGVDFHDVQIPHDWSVELKGDVGPFFKDGDYQMGYFKGGTGWYRRTIKVGNSEAQRLRDGETKAILYFEGIYNQSVVFINGHEVAKNHYGYHGFRVSLDSLLVNSQQLDILVKVINDGPNSRWYSGSGMYRHVWLEYHDKGYIDPWDVQITTDAISEGKAIVSFWVKGVKQFSRVIRNPRLWSPDDPYLYTMKVDGNEFKYGIRTVELSNLNGFMLNGVPTLLRGGCVHHDLGLLGAAALDKAEDRKLQLLKDLGYNAVRCSHNLQSEHFMHACDSIGLMVIDECFDQWFNQKNTNDYHNYFPEHYRQDIAFMVRRDRNHPSVVMWSLGNEIPGRHADNAQTAADQMRRVIHSLDNSLRPITAALCGWDDRSMDWRRDAPKAWRSLDAVGYNYLWQNYAADHDSFPELFMIATETFAKEAAINWQMVEKHPFVLGEFVWTAMDYLGEAGIGHSLVLKDGEKEPFFAKWPFYNGWCGDVDLIGQKKPQSYFRDVVWRRTPIAIAVAENIPEGSWNAVSGWGWPLEHNWWGPAQSDSTGAKRTVRVYSRAQKVRLYLNNKVIGTQSVDSTWTATFQVAYQPGELKAVVLNGTKEGESTILRSYGEPAALRVICDRTGLHADGQDLAFVTVELVDKDGNIVPDSDRKIHFESIATASTELSNRSQQSAATIYAGNASPTDMESFRNMNPRLFEGRAHAIVRTSIKPERFTLTISSDDLQPQVLSFVTK